MKKIVCVFGELKKKKKTLQIKKIDRADREKQKEVEWGNLLCVWSEARGAGVSLG